MSGAFVNLAHQAAITLDLDKRLRTCAHRGCRRGQMIWYRLCRHRRGTYLGNRWYCSPECLERGVLELLSELSRARPLQRTIRHRIPIGLLMMSQGLISSGQLRSAIELQRESGGVKLGECLQRLGFVSEEQVVAALAQQWACPVFRWNLKDQCCDSVVPAGLQQALRAIPVYQNQFTRTLYIGFSETVNYTALRLLQEMLECRAEPCIVAASVLDRYLQRLQQRSRRAEASFDLPIAQEEVGAIVREYVVKSGAGKVQGTLCGDRFWFRLSQGTAMDLLFRMGETDSTRTTTGSR